MTEIWGKKTFCLITGGSQGIGREIAKQFAEKLFPGSIMVLSARSVEGLKGTSSLINQVAPEISVELFPYDMSIPKEQDFSNLLKKFSPNDFDLFLLVHNAATEGSGLPIKECSDPEKWNAYMATNLHSMASLTSAFLKAFKHEDKIIVINITSLAAIQVIAGLGEYGVGKAAREMYMKVLSSESPLLRVLSYSPGPVDTSMVERVIDKVANNETKSTFVKMRDEVTLLKPHETVKKLVDLISVGLPPYSRIDYYD
ncbi:sepiapterin reductase [Halyomorpha halys]|uniref:sepiapterin reductase n=1 Tax=Halyomorpha halys TaxID=286706 RepID=UPI0006D50701|nr:sepiapterin reductase [Halyomorpha halys]